MGHFHLFMFIFLKHFAVAVTSLKKGEGVKVTIWVASWRVETETTKEHKQQDPEIDALHHVLADGKINFHIFITDKEMSKIVCIMRKTTSMAKISANVDYLTKMLLTSRRIFATWLELFNKWQLSILVVRKKNAKEATYFPCFLTFFKGQEGFGYSETLENLLSSYFSQLVNCVSTFKYEYAMQVNKL